MSPTRTTNGGSAHASPARELSRNTPDYQYGRFDVSALHIAHALKQTELQKAYHRPKEKPIDCYLVSDFQFLLRLIMDYEDRMISYNSIFIHMVLIIYNKTLADFWIFSIYCLKKYFFNTLYFLLWYFLVDTVQFRDIWYYLFIIVIHNDAEAGAMATLWRPIEINNRPP